LFIIILFIINFIHYNNNYSHFYWIKIILWYILNYINNFQLFIYSMCFIYLHLLKYKYFCYFHLFKHVYLFILDLRSLYHFYYLLIYSNLIYKIIKNIYIKNIFYYNNYYMKIDLLITFIILIICNKTLIIY